MPSQKEIAKRYHPPAPLRLQIVMAALLEKFDKRGKIAREKFDAALLTALEVGPRIFAVAMERPIDEAMAQSFVDMNGPSYIKELFPEMERLEKDMLAVRQ